MAASLWISLYLSNFSKYFVSKGTSKFKFFKNHARKILEKVENIGMEMFSCPTMLLRMREGVKLLVSFIAGIQTQQMCYKLHTAAIQ